MRIAAIYDIHANLPALEAVLDDIRRARVDRLVIGGDVLPGPMPRETIDALLAVDLPVECIRGNGDREVLALMRGEEPATVPERFRDAIRWVARQLGRDDEALLARWPATLRLEIPGIGPVLFCHATPRNDTDIFTRLTSEERLLPLFNDFDAGLVVCGHTHMQFDRLVGSIRIVNAGSVGMPFGEPGAYWLTIDDHGPLLRRTGYDLDRAAARIRATMYPQAEDFAARFVLNPPSEQYILDAYSRYELK